MAQQGSISSLWQKKRKWGQGTEQSKLSHDDVEFVGWGRWAGLVWVSACEGSGSHTRSTHCISAHKGSSGVIFVSTSVGISFAHFTICRKSTMSDISNLCQNGNAAWKISLLLLTGVFETFGWCFSTNTQEWDQSVTLPISVECVSCVYAVTVNFLPFWIRKESLLGIALWEGNLRQHAVS